jgi:hypothetical protein
MEYSLKYSLPSLTLKGCCYPLMVAGVPGFAVSKTRAQLQKEGKGDVKDVSGLRLEGHTGAPANARQSIVFRPMTQDSHWSRCHVVILH